jgi:hypothetical protein
MASPKREQASVVAFMFQTLPIADSVDTLDFSLSGSFPGRFHAAYARILGSDDLSVVFTIPTYTSHIFVGLSHEKQADVARILANVEDYERETDAALNPGDVIVLPNATQEASPFAIILLRAASWSDLGKVPDKTMIMDREMRFSLAVPLTRREWEYRSTLGHDALMALFQSEGKQVLFY